MRAAPAIAGAAVIVVILWDAFESIVLPRRVTHRFRLTRLFYASTWRPWAAVARRLPAGKTRQALLSAFGPLSLLMLVAFWAIGLVFGFSLLHAAAKTAAGYAMNLYMSGTTFFTLGLGDVAPSTSASRILTVFETGVGFGFLALTIGYLPVIYGAFSRRETNISLLDARAGSPPTARELLSRYARAEHRDSLAQFLRDWEVWTADLMESHLSYPVLCYYRSQHDNQSWLAALTAILDTCALLVAHAEGEIAWQARLTWAIARHVVVDVSQVLHIAPERDGAERLSPVSLDEIRTELRTAGVPLCARQEADEKLAGLRRMYEPYVGALGRRLLMEVPGWSHPHRAANWQTSAWEKQAAGLPQGEEESREHL